MGFFFKSGEEKRLDVIRQRLEKGESVLNEQWGVFQRFTAQEQVVVCQGALMFDKLLKSKYATIIELSSASPQDRTELQQKLMTFMSTQEAQPHLWIGLHFGFQWYSAYITYLATNDKQCAAIADRIWLMYEALIRHGLKFQA